MFPQDSGVLYIFFKLLDLGLTEEMINQGMNIMAGSDWSFLSLSVLRKRLRANGFFVQRNPRVLVDELEALIIGSIKLRDIYSQYR